MCLFCVTAQCPAEDCNGDRAYFFQLQIRSADEPMTTFLKVSVSLAAVMLAAASCAVLTAYDSVLHAVHAGEKIEHCHQVMVTTAIIVLSALLD
jgi:hypothetical protein